MQASREYITAETTPGETQSGIHRRLLFHAAWGVGAVVFVSIGWVAMRPWDPHGAVSLLTHVNPSMMMIEVLALAAVTSAIATVLAGQDHPDVGVFAVAIGLTLASLKGGNMTHLLLQTDGDPSLCLSLAAEGLFWSVVIVISMFAAAIVARWCGGCQTQDGDRCDTSSPRPTMPLAAMAAPGIPVVGWLLFGRAANRSEWHNGLKHLAMVAALALVLIRVFGAGATDRTIHHGQTCFAVAAGFYLGVGRAQTYFPVRSALWPCGAVPVVCVMAFAFSWFMSTGQASGGAFHSIPASSFLRPLPITYIAVGTSAAIVAHWRSMPAPPPPGAAGRASHPAESKYDRRR